MNMVNNTKVSTYSIYYRQYNLICKLVENKEFKSKSEVIREALDFFFLFPYFKQMARESVKKELRQEMLTEYYNAKLLNPIIVPNPESL